MLFKVGLRNRHSTEYRSLYLQALITLHSGSLTIWFSIELIPKHDGVCFIQYMFLCAILSPSNSYLRTILKQWFLELAYQMVPQLKSRYHNNASD